MQSATQAQGATVNAIAQADLELVGDTTRKRIALEDQTLGIGIVATVDQWHRRLELDAVTDRERITLTKLAEILANRESELTVAGTTKRGALDALTLEYSLADRQGPQVPRAAAFVLFLSAEESQQALFE